MLLGAELGLLHRETRADLGEGGKGVGIGKRCTPGGKQLSSFPVTD